MIITTKLLPFARRQLTTVSLLGALAAATSLPGAVSWHDIQFGGFASQGYLKSTNNNFPVDTKDGTFDFREIAFNASTTFGSHLRVGAQVFAQKLGKYGDDEPVLDWAIADYNFVPELGVQVGRLKYPRGLYSDVLDVDMVRPFIFLPQSNYDSRLRDYQASFDGALIYGSKSLGNHSFDYKVFYGDIPMKTDSGVADYFNTSTLFASPPGAQELGIESVRGAALRWNTPIPGLRFGANYSELSHLLVTGPFRQMPALTSSIDLDPVQYQGLSAEYTWNQWTFAGEYMLNKGQILLTLPPQLGQPATTSKFGSRNFYGAVSRRLGTQFEVGTYYSETRNGYPSAGATTDSLRRRDWAVAVRYDVNDYLLFKIEAHAINGTRDITHVQGISNPPAELRNSMTLFAAKTTLSF